MQRISTILAGIFLVLLSCASSPPAGETQQQPPAWVTSHQQEFPDALYLTGVGIAEDLDAAKRQAKAEIAGQIQSTVKSEITDIEKELQYEGSTTNTSDITRKIQDITDVSVSGITYPKTAQYEGKYYVLGVVDKQQYLQDITAQLATHLKTMANLHQSIYSQMDQGGLLTALDNFEQLSNQLSEFFSLRSIYNSVSSTPYARETDFTLSDVQTDILAQIRKIDVQFIGGTGQVAGTGDPLPSPFVAKVTYDRNGSTIPLAGMLLQFKNSDGSVIAGQETDARGQASVKATALPGSAPTRGSVEVSFGSMRYPALRTNLRSKNAIIQYQITSTGFAFHLVMADPGQSGGDRFLSTLQQELSGLGYSVDPAAPVSLESDIAITGSRAVKGFAGTQYMAEATATVKLVQKSTHTVLSQAQFTGRGVSTSSEQDAATMAKERIAVPTGQLSQMIANAGPQLQAIYRP